MPQVMETKRLTKLIGVIGRQSARQAAMIQLAAVSCIAHSIVHRNATPAGQLFDALGKGSRRDSLVVYFERFGNLAWSKVEDKVVFFDVGAVMQRDALEWTDEYAAKVEGTLWHNAKPEPKIKSTFDVEDAVSKLIDTCERAIKKGLDVKGTDLFDDVAAVFYKHRAGFTDERALQAAVKGATLSHLVETFGLSSDKARKILAQAKEINSEDETPASAEKLNELADKFGSTPALKVA